MNLNISADLSKRLRDEVKTYQMQCRLDAQRRSQQSACDLDALVNAALEGEKLEKFDCFEQ
jgi:hypothetical protein